MSTAIKLILLNLVLGVARACFEWSQVRGQLASAPHVSTEMIAMVTLVILALLMGLVIWLIYMIAKGRNWARITYLVLFLIGLPFTGLPLVRSFSDFPLSASFGFAQILLQIVALVLLFGADAQRWFKVPPVPPPLSA